ncbi:MAG TPA: hypothetical protein VFQ43_14580 [Nitrososphaera sp.]|nr:hypothetical protein [Nitrososphaera sp.]
MIEDVKKELNSQTPSTFHEEILNHALSLVKMSRSSMSDNYATWDMHDQVFKGIRYFDQDDIQQSREGKPVKMVVPNTFAQVMTFSSFLFLLFKQNKTFFELIPTGDEDYGDKQKDCELVLERDLRHNRWSGCMFQHLLDIGRFGPGIFECCWTRNLSHAYIASEPQQVTYNNVTTEVRSGSEWREYVKYEGNLVRPVSPYRWFPDTRFPLTEFQKGEFCAAEEEYSIAQLRKLQDAGEVGGIDRIEPFANNWKSLRGGESRFSFDVATETKKAVGALWKPGQSEGTVIVTKMQVWLVPKKFQLTAKNRSLGPEEFPILYHLWYANDNRVIRCEPAYWWHNDFGWSVSQFTPDMHHTVNTGLAELIYRIQDVITWHINSRITDVRRNMRGRRVVDPAGIETSSLDGDGDIYMRSGASKAGVDRFIKQLDMKDTTQGHLQDAEILGKIMQVVTGVNDNIMGQYNTGRRSAQEARTVLSGAAGRMKMHGFMIWEDGFAPIGKQMLSNSRQSLSAESFGRIIGGLPEEAAGRYTAFKGTPEEVIMADDYFTFDSTLSSEKGFMAQSLQDLLGVIMQSDPVAAAKVGQQINPAKIVDEIQYLRGSGNIKRFRYTPEEQQQIAQEQQARLEMENKPHPKPPSDSMSYKDVPEDVKRQFEQAAGFQPSQIGGTTETNGSTTSTTIDHSTSPSVDRSVHLTVHNKKETPNGSK